MILEPYFWFSGLNFFARKMADRVHPTMIMERISETQMKVITKTPFMELSALFIYGEAVSVKNPEGETLVSFFKVWLLLKFEISKTKRS